MKTLSLLVMFQASVLASDNKFSFAPESLERFSHMQFTWWGFKVYQAEVWTPNSGKPRFDQPLLLHITYQRNIKAEKLVSSTKDEWKRLKLIKPQSEGWLKELKKIWPDVKSGDSLTTFLDGDTTSFYQKGRLLGSVKNKEFGPVFLQIWLHEKSKTKDLLKKKK